MVIQSEQDRVKHLLAQALPLLCKGGLSFSNEFSIEALIGITLDKNDVFLVSIKETVTHDDDLCDGERSIDVSVTSMSEEANTRTPREHVRKRKHSRRSSQSSTDSQDEIEEINDSVAEKREKMDTILLHNDSFDSTADDSTHEHSNTNNSTDKVDRTIPLNSVFKTEPNANNHGVSIGGFGDVTADAVDGFDLVGYHAHGTQFIVPSSRDTADPSYIDSSPSVPGASVFPSQVTQTATPILPINVTPDMSAASTADQDKMNELLKDSLNASDFVGETSEGLWRCCICQKISRCKSNARKHVRVVHLKIRNSFCAYCRKGFGQTSNRKAHELTCSLKFPQIGSVVKIQPVFPERQFIEYYPPSSI